MVDQLRRVLDILVTKTKILQIESIYKCIKHLVKSKNLVKINVPGLTIY